MYYYLVEQPKTRSEKNRLEKIKDILANLGIAGEIAVASPARSVEELAEIGIAKNYSTIVAVGSERHVSKIISIILNKEIILGLIPPENSQLLDLIGSSTLNELCETLKYRKLSSFDLSKIEPNKYFLTKATISFPKSIGVRLEFPSYQVETVITDINILRDLKIILTNQATNKAKFWKFFNWLFGKKSYDINLSQFHDKKVKIETAQPLPVKVDGEVVAKTPVSVKLQPNVLKIITSRDKLKPKE